MTQSVKCKPRLKPVVSVDLNLVDEENVAVEFYDGDDAPGDEVWFSLFTTFQGRQGRWVKIYDSSFGDHFCLNDPSFRGWRPELEELLC